MLSLKNPEKHNMMMRCYLSPHVRDTMFAVFSVLDRCHVSVFTYVTWVYATVSLNKPQMDMREHGEVPWTSYSLHRAPQLDSERDAKQTAVPDKVYNTRFWSISNKLTPQTKQESNSVPTMCGHFARSAAPAHYLSRVKVKISRCSWVGRDSIPIRVPGEVNTKRC